MTSQTAMRTVTKSTHDRKLTDQDFNTIDFVGHYPTTVIIDPQRSIDGESHEAIRNIVWFAREKQRDAFRDGAERYCIEVGGRTLYGCEAVYYID